MNNTTLVIGGNSLNDEKGNKLIFKIYYKKIRKIQQEI